jgi:DNA-binding CsgD family transcriptional regulator
MVTVEGFSRLVSGIYAAALSPDLWLPTLEVLHRDLGGSGAGLMVATGPERSGAMVNPDAATSYAEYYWRHDYVLSAVERGPVGVVRSEDELTGANGKSEFFADWVLPNELDDGLFVRLTSGPRTATVAVAAPKRWAAFESSEPLKLLGQLVIHFQQALNAQDRLSALTNRTVEMAGALEQVGHGVVIVAGDHVAINLNCAAERIFRADDGLVLHVGRIVARSASTDQELHTAIQDALIGDSSGVREGRLLTCARPSGKRPYVIQVLPSYRGSADEPFGQPMSLILIIDPEDEPEPDITLLRRLYRLTDAEATVALQVMHGVELKEISERLSISLTTTRTHLQHVFVKTDTHRQAELVRLLLALRS